MIVAGFGFTSKATTHSLRNALAKTGAADAIAVLATAADKAGHEAIRALSEDVGQPIHAIPARQLEAAHTDTQSPISQRMRHTGSLAEAAALAAAGAGATLVVRRQISDDRMATCAIAQGPDT